MDRVRLDGTSTMLDRMNQLRFDWRREHGREPAERPAYLMTFHAYDRLLAEVAALMGPRRFRFEDWRQGSDFYFGIRIYRAPLTFGISGETIADVRLLRESEVIEILEARGWLQWLAEDGFKGWIP